MWSSIFGQWQHVSTPKKRHRLTLPEPVRPESSLSGNTSWLERARNFSLRKLLEAAAVFSNESGVSGVVDAVLIGSVERYAMTRTRRSILNPSGDAYCDITPLLGSDHLIFMGGSPFPVEWNYFFLEKIEQNY